MAEGSGPVPHLLMAVEDALCALPASQTVECLRPLRAEPVSGMPDFVRGVSIIRGVPTPVVDLGRLVRNIPTGRAERWVTVKVGDRRVALAVGGVPGVRDFEGEMLSGLPPLLGDSNAGGLEALGRLDARLLLLLRAGRLVPPDLWSRLGLPGGVA